MLIHKILGLSLGMILLSSAAFADTVSSAPTEPTSAQNIEAAQEGMHERSFDKEKMEKYRKERSEKFASRLNLTEEQRAKAKELHEKNRAKMKKIMDEINVLQEKAKALREQSKTEFEALLTDEQKETLKKIHEEHQDKMKHKRKHHFPHEKPMKPKED